MSLIHVSFVPIKVAKGWSRPQDPERAAICTSSTPRNSIAHSPTGPRPEPILGSVTGNTQNISRLFCRSTIRLTKTLININVCVYCSCYIKTLQYPIIQFTSKFKSDISFFSPMHRVMLFHMWTEECVCRKVLRSVRLY